MKIGFNPSKYIRKDVFPTPFCPGCGHGILLNSMIRAIDELKIDFKKTVFVSGIGCASWIPSPHLNTDTIHTTHGRAVAVATGIKTYNKDLNVIVVSGDGDLASIGGNHLIHAARRNIDITVICANNQIYGMTGGQTASTTPVNCKTSTAPTGNEEPPFDLINLVKGAGCNHTQKTTVYHAQRTINLIKDAISFEGFSFIEVVSPCFTQFGRRNKFSSPSEMLSSLRKYKFNN